MNRTALIIIAIVALVLSAAVTLVIYRQLVNMTGRSTEGEPSKIVVASHKLVLGQRISETDVKLVDWPASVDLEGSYSEMAGVIGRGVIVPMLPNEPVLDSKIAPAEAGAGLTTAIPEGMRAVAVKVNDVIGVAGFVLPGTRVDVVLTGSPTESSRSDTSKVILENVQVLAAGQNIEQEIDGEPQQVQVITLLVTPQDAQKLALASADGRIQLALRNPLDLESAETQPTERAALYRSNSAYELVDEPAKPKAAAPRAPRPILKPKPAEPPAPPPPIKFDVELIQGNDKEINTFLIEQSNAKNKEKEL
jgi:pilus assembly protein CpaB